jgi:hypothetical protein
MNGYFILSVAIAIASVAAYYSIIGLSALFSGAVIPVIIMGSVLEVAKLVTAAWLHEYWKKIPFLLKTYLTSAVIVLMLITSMGIFGFLSKAHIEQSGELSLASTQLAQNFDRIDQLSNKITSIENTITSESSKDSESFSSIQSQIKLEQENIDSAYLRIKSDLDRYEDSLKNAQSKKQTLENDINLINEYVSTGKVIEAQKIVGVQQDGNLGPRTREAIEEYIQRANTSIISAEEIISSSQNSITQLKLSIEPEIKQSNAIISRLKSQISFTDSEELREKILALQTEMEQLIETKNELVEKNFELEREIKLFEVEVGPVKYIAEMIYGESSERIIDDTIRYVILLIIFVFDPLAVLLVIAAGITFKNMKKVKDDVYDVPKTFDISDSGDIIDKKSDIIDTAHQKQDDVVLAKNSIVINKKLSQKNTRNFRYFFRRD